MASKKPSAAQPPVHIGRPTIYSEELIATICSRIAQGESMNRISKDDSMPALATMFRWMGEPDKKVFREKYDVAMQQRAEFLFEEMLDIADETARDTITGENGDRANTEWISRSKLRVDTRKWMLAKMVPKKYGDKVALSGDPENPLTVLLNGMAGASMPVVPDDD